MLAGLKDFAVLGVTTNIPYLIRILSHQTFIEADFDTQFLERNPEHFEPRVDPDERELAAALAGVFGRSNAPRVLSETTTSPTSPWQTLGNWRHN